MLPPETKLDDIKHQLGPRLHFRLTKWMKITTVGQARDVTDEEYIHTRGIGMGKLKRIRDIVGGQSDYAKLTYTQAIRLRFKRG